MAGEIRGLHYRNIMNPIVKCLDYSLILSIALFLNTLVVAGYVSKLSKLSFFENRQASGKELSLSYVTDMFLIKTDQYICHSCRKWNRVLWRVSRKRSVGNLRVCGGVG